MKGYMLGLLTSFLFIIFSAGAYATYFPSPYFTSDNLWTLENESWYYYKNLTSEITHEAIQGIYGIGISGNPILQTNGVENNYGTVLINASDYSVPWYWFEAEGGNISKAEAWNFTTDTNDFNSTNINSSKIGNYVEFNFVGSGFSIIRDTCPSCGFIDVYINDSLFAQIDTYGTLAHKQSNAIYYSQEDKALNVKLKVSNLKSSSSTGYVVILDAVKMGSSRYLPYLLEKLRFADDKYYNTAPGTASANYLATYHYLGYGWGVVFNQTFYVRLKNPTSTPILFGIADNTGYTDYASGTGLATAGKVYCNITVPAYTGWTLYKFNASSPECAIYTNATYAGMMRTFWHPNYYTSYYSYSYRLYANSSNLQVDSFWIAMNRNMPKIYTINARTGEDLSNGGYISCDDMRGSGVNITVTGLIPNSGYWRVRLYGSPTLLDYVFNTSGTLTANSTGAVVYNNVIADSTRICADYDYANWLNVYVDNSMSGMGGTTGSAFVFSSPPILVLPWNWAFPELKIVNLNTGVEEYILKPNTQYNVVSNVTWTNGSAIPSGISIYFSFAYMYSTEGVKGGYENPILLDGTTTYPLWADRQFNLNYNSTSKLWERNFTTPSEWKYDGHFSTLRLRVNNATNTTFRLRYTTWQTPIPVMFALFSNYVYSGSGIDIVSKDIDFGTSGNHPFYTTSGGGVPTFNDGTNDLWVEDNNKIILIYNSSTNNIAQTPITWYDKATGFAHYTSSSYWGPGYSYLGTYKQSRTVSADTGLGRDYSAIILRESNSLGHTYDVTLFIPANSDYMESYFNLPDITTLDFIYQAFRYRSYGNFRVLDSSKNYLETLYGRMSTNFYYLPFSYTGMLSYYPYSFSNVTAKPPSSCLGYTTSLPMPVSSGLNPCYPYCAQFFYSDWTKGYNMVQVNDRDFINNWKNVSIGVIVTEGLDEYRSDSQTWSLFTFNYGDMLNFNMRKMRVRFILSFSENPSYDVFMTENKTWHYGYPTSYSKESVDIYFDKNSRSYSGENVTFFIKTRNYTQPVSQTVNIYIIDQDGNTVNQTQLTTDSGGKANTTFSPNKTGTYIVKVNSTNYKGIGFFWVIRVKIPEALITSQPACYDSSSAIKYYACSFDNTSDVSVTQASGLIYSGSASDFIKTCFLNQTSDDYKFNITAKGEARFILPLARTSCTEIDRKVQVIEKQEYPSAPFGSYVTSERTRVQMILSYEKIIIQGSGKFAKGSHKICIEKIGERDNKPLVRISTC